MQDQKNLIILPTSDIQRNKYIRKSQNRTFSYLGTQIPFSFYFYLLTVITLKEKKHGEFMLGRSEDRFGVNT